MSNIEVLKDLQDRGLLKPLVVAGIIPAKVLSYIPIFYHVDAQIKTGCTKRNAVYCTAIEFKICERSVWNALRGLK